MIYARLIKLVSATDDDREFSYQVKKAAEGVYIKRIWGWDETIQRKYHETDWNENRPDIIKYYGKSIGTLCVVENDQYIQIGQFFILPEYQRKGVGSYLLRKVLQRADDTGLISRVAFLKGNPVESLYIRNGFHLTDEQGQYRFMERNPQ